MEMSLREELTKSLKTCELTGKNYVPFDVIEKTITYDRVKNELPRGTLTWCGNCRLYSSFPQARRIIAILVFACKLEALQSLLDNGLTDDDLPLRYQSGVGPVSGKRGNRPFASFKRGKFPDLADLFLENQWKVWIPDLNRLLAGHLEPSLLELECAFPFLSCDLVYKASHAVYIYKALVPPPHQTVVPPCVSLFFEPPTFRQMPRYGTDKPNV
jgi:hypothetical protein